jgi:hypothetical protein
MLAFIVEKGNLSQLSIEIHRDSMFLMFFVSWGAWIIAGRDGIRASNLTIKPFERQLSTSLIF